LRGGAATPIVQLNSIFSAKMDPRENPEKNPVMMHPASSGQALLYDQPQFSNPRTTSSYTVCMRESSLFQLLFPLAIVTYPIFGR
jgi:hypothetical protein